MIPTSRTEAPPPGRPAIFVFLVLLSLVVVAGAGFLRAFSTEPWVRFAAVVEGARSLPGIADGVRHQLAERVDVGIEGRCGDDRPLAMVTVSVYLLRLALRDNQPDAERNEALNAARKVVREGIACNPTDGNLWYVLALLDARAGADDDRVLALLSMSARMAPAEADTLYKRGSFLGGKPLVREIATDSLLMRDLANAVAYLLPREALAVLEALRKAGSEDVASRIVASLPVQRRDMLAAAENATPSTFGRPERYRTFDLSPLGGADAVR